MGLCRKNIFGQSFFSCINSYCKKETLKWTLWYIFRQKEWTIRSRYHVTLLGAIRPKALILDYFLNQFPMLSFHWGRILYGSSFVFLSCTILRRLNRHFICVKFSQSMKDSVGQICCKKCFYCGKKGCHFHKVLSTFDRHTLVHKNNFINFILFFNAIYCVRCKKTRV